MILSRRKKPHSRLFRKKNPRQGGTILEARDRKEENGLEASFSQVPMEAAWRKKIVEAYFSLLERCSAPVERESLLPFPKDLIRQALYEELRDNLDALCRSRLEIAFLQLESFLPEDEYQVIKEFKFASILAQEMAKTGDPGAIMASALVIKQNLGESAIKIQERISEKIRRRMNQIHDLRISVVEPRAPFSC